MWISRKKYTKIINLISELGSEVSKSVEDFQEAIEELNLQTKLIQEELAKKNQFIENLLSQMIGGAVNSISGIKRETTTTILEPVKPVSKSMQDYITKKNGGLKLPG